MTRLSNTEPGGGVSVVQMVDEFLKWHRGVLACRLLQTLTSKSVSTTFDASSLIVSHIIII